MTTLITVTVKAHRLGIPKDPQSKNGINCLSSINSQVLETVGTKREETK